MHEAAIARLSRFRATRPGFDAVLRDSIVPQIRGHDGVRGLLAGRQGPDEVGERLLVSLWASRAAMERALGPAAGTSADTGPWAGTTHATTEVLSALVAHIAETPLRAGILRLGRGRLGDGDLAGFAEMITRELVVTQAGMARPHDLVMAAADEVTFVMLSTWPDWSSIEAATGASIAEPLRTKRLPALEAFEAAHFELL